MNLDMLTPSQYEEYWTDLNLIEPRVQRTIVTQYLAN